MSPSQLSRAQRLALAGAAGALALAILACLAGIGLSVARGVANPGTLPPIDLKLGGQELWIGVTNNPLCPPMLPGCIIVVPSNWLWLSVWHVTSTYSPGGVSSDAESLLQMRLR